MSDAFIYVRERRLPYETFDADNHMYENRDALTKFVPAEYEGIIKYVDINGRTKLAVRDMISDYIPNPTFTRVAVPGGYGRDVTKHDEQVNPADRGRKVRVMPGMDAFFDPEPRLELMKDMGIDRTLLWPTLASVLEERVADDPDAACAVVHALNQWMHEHWTFNYQDRIFPTPVIHLGIVDDAIEELEWVLERGARIILVRPAPVHGYLGPRSFALPEFDPFWEKVQEAGIPVGMHASDSGYQRYFDEWEGNTRGEMLPFKGGSGFMAIVSHQGRPIMDTIASLIGHGLCSRFPDLRFAPVENGSNWVRPILDHMANAYAMAPNAFDEDPVEVFKRNIYVHPFHEEDPIGLVELLGADRVLFGSDYPHPEGMSDPISFVDDLTSLAPDDVAKVMGGNLSRLMGVDAEEKVAA
jgi:predicted TIM-barrel fold metal-dependent hydrolase